MFRGNFIYAGNPKRVTDIQGTGAVLTVAAGSLTTTAITPFTREQLNSANFNGSTRVNFSGYTAPTNQNLTVEFWFKNANLPSVDETRMLYVNRPDGPSYSPIDLYVQRYSPSTGSNTRLVLLATAQTSNWDGVVYGTTNLNATSWYHVAIVKNGTSMKVYLNGTLEITVTLSSATLALTPTTSYLSSWPAGGNFFQGNVASFRYVKGTALYSANFTPPTEPNQFIANTMFLAPLFAS